VNIECVQAAPTARITCDNRLSSNFFSVAEEAVAKYHEETAGIGWVAAARARQLQRAVRARRVQLAQVQQREEERVGGMGMRPAGSRISC
jgi:hypothetical protein